MEEIICPEGIRILRDDVSERRLYPPGRLRLIVAIACAGEDIGEITRAHVGKLSEAVATVLHASPIESGRIDPEDIGISGWLAETTHRTWTFETTDSHEIARRVCAVIFPLLIQIDDSEPRNWQVMIDISELREYHCLGLGGPLDMINKAIPE